MVSLHQSLARGCHGLLPKRLRLGHRLLLGDLMWGAEAALMGLCLADLIL